MNDRILILCINLYCGMHFRRCCSANQEWNVQATMLHFSGHVYHFIQAWCNQATQPDHICIFGNCRLQYLFGRHHDAQVYNLIIITGQYDTDNILADIVYITLYRSHQYFTGTGSGTVFFLFNIRLQIGYRLLHDTGRFYYLRQKHLTTAKQVAHQVHPGHQVYLYHLERPLAL
ncbi:hypothetical protein D9M68_567670 [compost metagenome]